jgi:ribosomal protein S18 acetylase RimI-like enzyme
MITEIAGGQKLGESAALVRESFATVAARFGLTRENCPTHPSFTTTEKLEELRGKGVRLFGLYEGEREVGFCAVEKADESLYYLEKLAVHPAFRGRGHGGELLNFACGHVERNGGSAVSIAVIDTDAKLKQWYAGFGFIEGEAVDFAHLPFRVRFMRKTL